MTLARRSARTACTFFGCGLSPIAPGTAGTLGAMVCYGLAAHYGLATPAGLGAVLLAVTLAGIPLARWCERDLGENDPGCFVLDEVAGYLVAVLFLPVGLSTALGAFVSFRLFDIAKPYPIRRLERLGGGVGVMVDDLWAGLYANLSLRLGISLLGLGGSGG